MKLRKIFVYRWRNKAACGRLYEQENQNGSIQAMTRYANLLVKTMFIVSKQRQVSNKINFLNEFQWSRAQVLYEFVFLIALFSRYLIAESRLRAFTVAEGGKLMFSRSNSFFNKFNRSRMSRLIKSQLKHHPSFLQILQ